MITANKNHRHAAASGGSQSHSRRSISCAKAWAIWPDLTSGCDDLTFDPHGIPSRPPRSGSPQTAAPWNAQNKMGEHHGDQMRPNLGPLCQNDPYLKVISTDISWLNALVGETKGFEGSPISGRTVWHTQSGHLTVATFVSVETSKCQQWSIPINILVRIWSHSLFRNCGLSLTSGEKQSGDKSAPVTLAHGFHTFSSNEHDELASAGGTQNYHHSKINQL
jgi:hypothetical protein